MPAINVRTQRMAVAAISLVKERFFPTTAEIAVLDCPCGDQWTRPVLEAAGIRFGYTGVDVCGGPGVVTADLNQGIPAPAASQDLVLSFEGIEHLENPIHFLRELVRVLKPGGVTIISTPNVQSISSRWCFFWRGHPGSFPILERIPPLGEHYHVSPVPISHLLCVAQTLGLTVEAVPKASLLLKDYKYLPLAWLAGIRGWFKPKDHHHLKYLQFRRDLLLGFGYVVVLRKP